ncbi:MAG: hypothetical protein AAB921_00115, partial [Patescibacteria group bacterium]
KEGRDSNTKWSLAIQNSLKNGEAQNLYALAPNPPSARNQPRHFEEHYKTAGWLPHNPKSPQS